MKHNEHLVEHSNLIVGGKALVARMNGRFYTPEFLAERLAEVLISGVPSFTRRKVRIIDPFCGDGRLIVAFLRLAAFSPKFKAANFLISLWDNDSAAVVLARERVEACGKKLMLRLKIEAESGDTFLRDGAGEYDLLLTNPPWEALKPDRRELEQLTPEVRVAYVAALRDYDERLARLLPQSQPEKKFSGWGTNLSRCGLELSIRLLRPGGWCGIVLPSSLFSDQVSARFRRWLLHDAALRRVLAYPAEARLFDGVDQTCAAAIFERTPDAEFAPLLSRFDAERKLIGESRLELSRPELERLGYAVPLDLAADEMRFLLRLSPLPRLDDLCGDEPDALWLGREWDETGYHRFTAAKGTVPFVKGRAVSRYAVLNSFTEFVSDGSRALPVSAAHARLTWRDVSRRSQVRRMIATLLPADCVTGNSLHVGYFKDGDTDKLHALLGVINSLPFEFQLRSKLGTGHVSLGSVREVRVPRFDDARTVRTLSALTRRVLDGEAGAEATVEVAVARAYGLTREEFIMQLGFFDRLPEDFRAEMLELFDSEPDTQDVVPAVDRNCEATQVTLHGMEARIPNHYSAKVSKLDLAVAIAVPPGGNWKNIPHSVPSKRLEQIRVSFAAGEGSRSTYYGRLHPARPAYTINTYFNRPGNGCHLHYDYAGGQHRVLSEREAARLQSFPDRFAFVGAHLSVQKQIGNAVPPLLAFQIARTLPVVGQYVDLFSGAGGLSLGFRWAGWEPIVANDIEDNFLESYRRNIHPVAVTGDIREPHIFRRLVEIITRERRNGVPLLVIGGPPCQGFSTAGNCRSLGDERNHLFKEFKSLVETIRPDGFVFENVTGLLNMEGGSVFEMIRRELQILDNPLVPWVLKAEEYAIPQRRTRLFLMSLPKRWGAVSPPVPTTSMEAEVSLFCRTQRAISTEDALADLPPLRPGQDGSSSDYLSEPRHPYQALMRAKLDAGEYLDAIRAGVGVPV